MARETIALRRRDVSTMSNAIDSGAFLRAPASTSIASLSATGKLFYLAVVLSSRQIVLCQSRGVREIIGAPRRPHGNVVLPRPRAMGAAEVFCGRHGIRRRGQGWRQPSLCVPVKLFVCLFLCWPTAQGG